MKATALLISEHKLILRAIDVLDAMTDLAENTGALDRADIDAILDFLTWFADAHHQAKEERILFPALTRAAASQGRPVAHLVLEHGQERILLEDIEKEVRLAQFPDFVMSANRLSSTLRNHIYKEDHILFETADSLLNVLEDELVFEQLSKFDTTLDKETLDKKLEHLRSLEWKYLRK
jgi:hemerythrin-like domain-containing protein